jgi:hypothetical protein
MELRRWERVLAGWGIDRFGRREEEQTGGSGLRFTIPPIAKSAMDGATGFGGGERKNLISRCEEEKKASIARR